MRVTGYLDASDLIDVARIKISSLASSVLHAAPFLVSCILSWCLASLFCVLDAAVLLFAYHIKFGGLPGAWRRRSALLG